MGEHLGVRDRPITIQLALGEGCMSTAWVYGVVGLHPWLMGLFDALNRSATRLPAVPYDALRLRLGK